MRIFLLLSVLVPASSFAQDAGAALTRNVAQYTKIYSDDIETIAPALGAAFSLGPAGSLTSDPTELIAGHESIRGVYSGADAYTTFLQTVPSVLPLTPNHAYQVAFQYTILTPSANGFQAFLNSSTALSQGVGGIGGATINGAAGKQGTASFTATTNSYPDYAVLWGINGAGAISIDNIQIIDAATGNVIASENAEGTGPTLKSGVELQGRGVVVTNPSLVISGKASLQLSNGGGFVTNPSLIPIGANTVYTIQFDYRILSPTSTNKVISASFQPAGTKDTQLQVAIPGMLRNALATGTFSSGAQTAGAAPYVLMLFVEPGASVIVDNIVVYRQDVSTQSAPPLSWNRLLTTPFPRLGNFFEGRTDNVAALAYDEGAPFTYSVGQVENRLAFSDVIGGLVIQNQTQNPDSIHRIRALNPDAVILAERFIETQYNQPPPSAANIDPDYQLLQSTPGQWKATDNAGNVAYNPNYPSVFFMNISEFVPAINGQTWRTALQNYMTTQVFPSGVWDGMFLSDAHAVLDPAFPNYDDPALFNYDWNRNGLRDETPAGTSDMIRAAKVQMLQQLNSSTNGLQFTMGHTAAPEFALAPYVNGFAFECFNLWFGEAGAPITSSSPARWRTAFESYLQMQAAELPPQANILEGCGATAAGINMGPGASDHYIGATPDDIAKHRFTMGTALLGNGFYDYDLKDSLSAPYWFDEFSVDTSGNAVEDRAKKGYLGQPLSDAVELTGPGTLVFQEGFDGSAFPTTFETSSSAVFITQAPADVIAGTGSLIISNPDHTKKGTVGVSTNAALVPLGAGVTYLLSFDWRILETLDFPLGFEVFVTGGGKTLDRAFPPGVVAGDFGTMHFPFTIPSPGSWTINFYILNGGGKIAIDNVKIHQGGVGPWRRDFENGLVLVNPFGQAHTFSATDLAGALHRTGIHRIKGTQAPDINNGQPVASDLTVGPFDSIILLADPIRLGSPVVIAVANAAGGQPGVASGAFVSIYGSNFTPLPYDDWSKAIINGQLPKQLDGTSVTIGGKPAYIYAITPGQINVQAPDIGNSPAQVIVTTGGGSSAPFATNSQVYSPAFFTWPGNQPVATHLDYTIAAIDGTFQGLTTVPARPAEVIVLWGSGFGPTNPAVAAGHQPTVTAPPTQSPITVKLGATAVPVLAAVLSSYAGLYQIAIQIPASIADGDYAIVASVATAESPGAVMLSIRR